MKNLLSTISLTTLLTLSSTATIAGNKHHRQNHSFDDTAKVTHVEPLYRTVRVSTPQRECWDRPQYKSHRSDYKSYTSTIAGGIVGGVLGNQFGGGKGKTAMTVAGTLLGGSIGRDLGYNSQRQDNDYRNGGEQCRVTERYHEEERADGYRVTYRYHGQTYTTRTDHHPGKRIPVEVSVRPANTYY
jgi:uncharacterized protein YcfJ